MVYASAGQVDIRRMPDIDQNVDASLHDLVYDTSNPLAIGSERIGEVRTDCRSPFVASRQSILSQGLAIASAEVVLSFLLLGVAGLLLTRHIRYLVSATQRVADGDCSNRIPVAGRDEIALLATNFNTMSDSIHERIEALHRSETRLTTAQRTAHLGNWNGISLRDAATGQQKFTTCSDMNRTSSHPTMGSILSACIPMITAPLTQPSMQHALPAPPTVSTIALC